MLKKAGILFFLLPLLLAGCVGEETEQPQAPTDTQETRELDNEVSPVPSPGPGCDAIELAVADCVFSGKDNTVSLKLANLGTEPFSGPLKAKASFGDYSSQELTTNISVGSSGFKEVEIQGFNQPTEINSIELTPSSCPVLAINHCPNSLEDQGTQLEVEVRFDKHSYRPGESGKVTIIISDSIAPNPQEEYPDVLQSIGYSFDPITTGLQALRQKFLVTDFAYGDPNVREKPFSVDKYAEPGFYKFNLWLEWQEGTTEEIESYSHAGEYSILVTG